MNYFHYVLGIFGVGIHGVKPIVQPQMSSRIVAGTLCCSQIAVVSLAVVDLSSLINVSRYVITHSMLNDEQVRQLSDYVNDKNDG